MKKNTAFAFLSAFRMLTLPLTVLLFTAVIDSGEAHADDGVLRINFQAAGHPKPLRTGIVHLEDTGELYGDRGNGYSYGWSDDQTGDGRRRYDIGDCRLDGHVRGNSETWEIDLTNGNYLVNITVGDPDNLGSFSFGIEGTSVVDPESSHYFHVVENMAVTVNDGKLSIYDTTGDFKVCFIEIVDAATGFPAKEVFPAVDPAQLAFPTAEGFAKNITGGRGGDVYHVTNLNWKGPGSLQEGFATTYEYYPRTIVFDVSGHIGCSNPIPGKGSLGCNGTDGDMNFNGFNITVAGQTAPGKGITIRDHPVKIKNSGNIVMRYFHIRLGDENKGPVNGDDGLTSEDNDGLILDHVSMSWTIDGMWDSRRCGNMSVQWCMFVEPLDDSLHVKGKHGYLMSFRDIDKSISIHHNLFSSGKTRHPTLGSNGYEDPNDMLCDFRNNINYNWGSGNCRIGTSYQNLINNTFRYGPNGFGNNEMINVQWHMPYPWGYLGGNVFESIDPQDTANCIAYTADNYLPIIYTDYGEPSDPAVRSEFELFSEVLVPGYVPPLTESPAVSFQKVVDHAGCSLVRDAVDTRMMDNVVNSTGDMIDSQADVGGWDNYTAETRLAGFDTDQDGMPNVWEVARGLDPNDPEDRNDDRNSDGYTNLEEYLDWLLLSPEKASNPSPADNAIASPTTLSCNDAPGAVSYNIYFSDLLSDIDNDLNPNATGPPELGSLTLVAGVQYYWRVDTVALDSSVIEGDVWTFTVPADGDFDVDGDVDDDDLDQWKDNYGQTVDNQVYDGSSFLLWQRNFTGPAQTALAVASETVSPEVQATGAVASVPSTAAEASAEADSPASSPASGLDELPTPGAAGSIANSLVESQALAEGLLGVYLDFDANGVPYTSTTPGFTSVSVTTDAVDWGYPDDSDDSYHVRGDIYDSKDNVASDFEAVIAGLNVGKSYKVFLKAFYNGTNRGFTWGIGSPSITDHDPTTANVSDPGIIYIAGQGSGDKGSYLYQLGSTHIANGSGEISIYFGTGTERSELDGVFVVDVTDDDGDGLPAVWEALYGLDDNDATGVNGAAGDPDGDLLSNIDEYTNQTFPNDPDSDGDTLDDKQEVTGSQNPFGGAPTDPTAADTDNDAIDDGVELSSANGFITNPNSSDTDGDNFSDGLEISFGSDPTNVLDFPTTGISGLPNYDYAGFPEHALLARFDEDTDTPLGHGAVGMFKGYMLVIFTEEGDGGGQGTSGFSMIDISDPTLPVTAFTTLGNPFYNDPATLQYVGNLREPHSFSFSGDYCCMTTSNLPDNEAGLQFWDFSDPLNPIKLSEINLSGLTGGNYSSTPWWVCWQGGRYAYAAGATGGLYIVDTTDIYNPVEVTHLETANTGGFRLNVVLAVGNMLVGSRSDGSGGLTTFDISDPINPVILDTVIQEAGYSMMFNGNKILGPRDPALIYSVHPTTGVITLIGQGEDVAGKGGYGVFKDGDFYYGSSSDFVILDLDTYQAVATFEPPGFTGADWDFGVALGNLVWVGSDHGTGSALMIGDSAPDSIAPAVNMVNPVAGGTNIALTSRIGITLTDQIETSSISNATFIVRPQGGSALAGKYSNQTGIVNFCPDVPLDPFTTYEVVIVANGINDLAGNGVESFFSTFTTGGIGDPIEVDAVSPGANATGLSVAFIATQLNALNPEYSWDFGDGSSPTAFSASDASISYTYSTPGNYSVLVTLRDGVAQTSKAFTQVVHWPLTSNTPTNSSTIVYDAANNRVWNVNPDNNTVTAMNATTFAKELEIAVGINPRTVALVGPNNEIWVTCQDDDNILRINRGTGNVIGTIPFNYGEAPYGIVFSPDLAAAYATLEGSGFLVRLNPVTGSITGTLDVGAKPRGIAVTADGSRILVTRFVSPDTQGEVLDVNAASLSVTDTIGLAIDLGPDAEDTGRGLPNYISTIAISPDGKHAWVPSKKDNIERGEFLEGGSFVPGAGFENTVRSIASKINLGANPGDGVEEPNSRLDFNDRDLASSVAFSQYGNYVFVTTQGNQRIEIIDNYSNEHFGSMVIPPSNRAPQGLAVSEDGTKLFVHNYMSRVVSVFDIDSLTEGLSGITPHLIDVDTVSSEVLTAQVLAGKQIFYNADDDRMNQDGYISCASCHLDGGSDGRTLDFTDRGEGLRNTVDLKGRGVGHGPVHWTANFDEIQDFEHDMRGPFGGDGFLADDDFNSGTRNQPLGDLKAGINPELDALAAYVASLTTVGKSPYRNADGSITSDGLAGKALFAQLKCATCHAGVAFTDSISLARHDVGTITAGSGQRLGGTLDGFDTPTVRGLWRTAPYLHDGSAATVLDVFGTAYHQTAVATLSAPELNQLVDYLVQIDDAETTAPIEGDFDADGDVDGDDLEQWKADYGQTVNNKVVDGSDFLRWQRNLTGSKSTVPNVVDSSQSAAITAITGLGLTAGPITQANHASVAAGDVISSSPVAGASLPLGGAVSIVVSLGPGPVNVPDVVGLTESAATAAIEGAGLSVGTVTQANSPTVAVGEVISSNPAVGVSVPFGSSVDLVVSLGPDGVSILSAWTTTFTGTTSTHTHTRPAGTNRALVFTAHLEANETDMNITNVAYGGQNMTVVLQKNQSSGTSKRIYVAAFVLGEAGIAVAADSTFVVTWAVDPSTFSRDPSYASVFLEGVDQTNLIGASDDGGADAVTSVSTGPLATSVGDLVIVAATHEKGDDFAYTVDNATFSTHWMGESSRSVVGHQINATGANITPQVSSLYESGGVLTGKRQAIVGLVVNSIASSAVAASSAAGEELPPAMLSSSSVAAAPLFPKNQATSVSAPAETVPSPPNPAPFSSVPSAGSDSAISMTATTQTAAARPVTGLRLLIIKARLRQASVQVRQGKTRQAQRLLQELVDELNERLTDTSEDDRKAKKIKQSLASAYTELADIAAKADSPSEETRLRNLAQEMRRVRRNK